MAFFGWFSAAWSLIKIIWDLYGILKAIKKNDETFKSSALLKEINESIADFKFTGKLDKLKEIQHKMNSMCEGVGCPPTTKTL